MHPSSPPPSALRSLEHDACRCSYSPSSPAPSRPWTKHALPDQVPSTALGKTSPRPLDAAVPTLHVIISPGHPVSHALSSSCSSRTDRHRSLPVTCAPRHSFDRARYPGDRMASTKPKLPQLQTPMTSTFPSELSALPSARSPLPGYADFIKTEDAIKTPITPPVAYIDFLKSMASSPITADRSDKSSGGTTPTSAPSTGSSMHSECSCNGESRKSPISSAPLSGRSFVYPSSAPSSARPGRLRIPPSPIFSTAESPLSAASTIRSPFSARSARSPYDWSYCSRSRYFDAKSPKTRSSVRQVREIVTRTVTYTPRMSPAPKGKRRKIE